MEAGGVGISERQLEVCCLLGGNEYMYAVVHRESCCNIGNLESPSWQLERRGHFRRHSLKVVYLLCSFSVY